MQVVGHRGARGLAPENTLTSFKKALLHQVDIVETDLRVTRDRVVVLHHNRRVVAPSGQKKWISSSSFDELLKLKPDLTTLDEALDRLGKKVCWHLEIKPRQPVEPIVKAIKQQLTKGWPKTNLRIASKSQASLRQIKEALPNIDLVVIERWSGVKANYRCRQLGTDLVHMNQLFLYPWFIKMFSRHSRLYAYTLNDPKKAKRWAANGLTGVITDYPDRFR